MNTEKQLESMEEELKLMKGQLKQSLASVRDYLLNMELPASEFATVLAALGAEGGDQKITMKGTFSPPPDGGLGKPAQEANESSVPEEEDLINPEEDDIVSPDDPLESDPDTPLGDEPFNQDDNLGPEAELPSEDGLVNQDDDLLPASDLLSEDADGELGELEESLLPELDLPTEEDRPMANGKINTEVSQSIPKVNLMANLIQWVSKAKKEIGSEQLPTFLEVYGVSGHLSPELKEVILHLVDISSENNAETTIAEIWGQAMLSLHGILTGGDAPLYPVKPVWNNGDSNMQSSEDEITEVVTEKPKDMPLKLKLVFPDGDGKDKEFCVNLSPETASNGS